MKRFVSQSEFKLTLSIMFIDPVISFGILKAKVKICNYIFRAIFFFIKFLVKFNGVLIRMFSLKLWCTNPTKYDNVVRQLEGHLANLILLLSFIPILLYEMHSPNFERRN